MKQCRFSRRLRELREASGLTCNELARRAGLAAGLVSRLERGERSPSLETARLLAKALGQRSLSCWD